jgi:hypothetical protein
LSASGRLSPLLAATLIQLPTGTIDVAPGPSGSIYVVRLASPAVVVIDSTGAVTGEIDVPGMGIPGGIDVASDGSLAISDAAAGIIVVVGPEGTVRRTLASPGSPGPVAWAGTSIWYASLDLGVVAEAGTGVVIVETGLPAGSLDVRGREGLLGSDGACIRFSSTDGVTDTIYARSACFAGDAVLVLAGGEVGFDSSSTPVADSLESFARVLWIPWSGPAVFSRERGLLRL